MTAWTRCKSLACWVLAADQGPSSRRDLSWRRQAWETDKRLNTRDLCAQINTPQARRINAVPNRPPCNGVEARSHPAQHEGGYDWAALPDGGYFVEWYE